MAKDKTIKDACFGGNAVVGQSGGPTAAINATLAGVVRGCMAARQSGAVAKLYGMRNGIEGFMENRLVDLFEDFADEKRISLLEQTPAAYLGSCRKKLPDAAKDPAFYEKLMLLLKQHDIRYFFYIGGNDSMDTVAKLSAYAKKQQYDIRVIGIPKTVDNDLLGTDHTPGFGSAARYIATTLTEIVRDCAVYTVPAVTVVEIMGRDAGWLTASSAVGRIVTGEAPDYVYLPEVPFSMEKFFSDVRTELSRHPNVVIAVSEGIRNEAGEYICECTSAGTVDVFGHKQLSGTAKALEIAVREEFGCKVRSIELNLPQRCAAHLLSGQDMAESVRVGKAAVKAAVTGKTGVMMAFRRTGKKQYGCRIVAADVSKIANGIRYVPSDMIVPQGNNVTDGCCEYILPLIGKNPKIRFEKGLPVHISL
ncbi:MAG: 6-phosphofructokinase [Clostridia bacterium]|nr:6-phosphofructokinase [Clostridia bacterium]